MKELIEIFNHRMNNLEAINGFYSENSYNHLILPKIDELRNDNRFALESLFTQNLIHDRYGHLMRELAELYDELTKHYVKRMNPSSVLQEFADVLMFALDFTVLLYPSFFDKDKQELFDLKHLSPVGTAQKEVNIRLDVEHHNFLNSVFTLSGSIMDQLKNKPWKNQDKVRPSINTELIYNYLGYFWEAIISWIKFVTPTPLDEIYITKFIINCNRD